MNDGEHSGYSNVLSYSFDVSRALLNALWNLNAMCFETFRIQILAMNCNRCGKRVGFALPRCCALASGRLVLVVGDSACISRQSFKEDFPRTVYTFYKSCVYWTVHHCDC